MKNGNGIINLAKNLTGKNGFNPQIIPILKFPKSENEFVCSIFNKDTKTIDIYFININSSIPEQFQIENYPVETCESCKCKLGIDNLSYIGNYEIRKLYCSNCCPDKGTIVNLYPPNIIDSGNIELIDELKLYLEKNKDSSSPECTNLMNKLINYIITMYLLLNALKSNDIFKNYLLFIENYINSFSSYIKIVQELHMNNLYLFLRNLFIISTINNDDRFLKGLFLFYSKKKDCFNVSSIQTRILEKAKENNTNDILLNLNMTNKYEKGLEDFRLIKNIYELDKDVASLKNDLDEKKNSVFQRKIRIMEFKKDIIDFLRNYNYSYN